MILAGGKINRAVSILADGGVMSTPLRRDARPPDRSRTNQMTQSKTVASGTSAPEVVSMYEEKCSLRFASGSSSRSPTTNEEIIQ